MSSLWNPINELHEIVALMVVPVICGAALLFGSKVERVAAIVALIDALAISVLAALVGTIDRPLATDIKAILILVCYVAMTLRWSNRWLVLMTALQAFAVLLHLSTRLDQTIIMPISGLLLNLTGWAMLILLAAVTITHGFARLENGRPDRRIFPREEKT